MHSSNNIIVEQVNNLLAYDSQINKFSAEGTRVSTQQSSLKLSHLSETNHPHITSKIL